jgi:hypothetical protein
MPQQNAFGSARELPAATICLKSTTGSNLLELEHNLTTQVNHLDCLLWVFILRSVAWKMLLLPPRTLQPDLKFQDFAKPLLQLRH